ncbi:hypothetical protein SAMN05444280_106122 [Tangfeifania diversioriginum]|uniref:Uncharacterized protein n=1 Tax=Tangfeifania diversioriginum TaxID=1168035 RepID=A0A1M6EA58_9BACT|nr:hypothetical protein SAMN05444280_106122 [Tangfeifania diversioriginum]
MKSMYYPLLFTTVNIQNSFFNMLINAYNYINRLQNLEAGQVISVDIIRDEEEKVLLIQL